MHRTTDGTDGTMTLHCHQASKPEDHICCGPHNQTPAA
jgi:hypothetical protein